MYRLRTIILKSWFQALIISLLVILFLPDVFDKYKLTFTDNWKKESFTELVNYVADIDKDGYSEIIKSFEARNIHSLQVITWDGGILNQWNTDGQILNKNCRVISCDTDNDSIDEIYTTYRIADTVYLYGIEPFDTISPVKIDKREIFTLTHEFNEPDAYIAQINCSDVNGDNHKDLIMVVISGQARIPRNIFVIDIQNNTISSSPNYASVPVKSIEIFDFDNDGRSEITGSTLAAGQMHDSLGYMYSDYSAWVMAFDSDFNLLFDPIEFPGITSSVTVYPVEMKGNYVLVCFYNHCGPLDNYPKLFILDMNGIIINEYNFPKSIKIRRDLVITSDKEIIHFNIIDENGKIQVFNDKLEIINEYELNVKVSPTFWTYDLNNDGNEERIINTNHRSGFLITDNNFSNIIEMTFDFPVVFSETSIIKNGDNLPSILITGDKKYTIAKYENNVLYYLQYLIYISIFLFIWFFIILIRKLQMIQIKKKEKIQKEIVNLQLKSFRNQMDPHFTFNVFNTIAHKIQEESPKSYKAFMEFSNIVRSTLISSEKITRSIDEELNQLVSYLELEKIRFPDKLTYSINIDKNIDHSMHVPKMILQTYVENAIKHGIRHKKSKGNVSIKLYRSDKYVYFQITDDGVGREKSKEYSGDSTGFGLKIMNNYFKLFNENNSSKIKSEIIDLYDDNKQPAGTQVTIAIPINFKMSL